MASILGCLQDDKSPRLISAIAPPYTLTVDTSQREEDDTGGENLMSGATTPVRDEAGVDVGRVDSTDQLPHTGGSGLVPPSGSEGRPSSEGKPVVSAAPARTSWYCEPQLLPDRRILHRKTPTTLSSLVISSESLAAMRK